MTEHESEEARIVAPDDAEGHVSAALATPAGPQLPAKLADELRAFLSGDMVPSDEDPGEVQRRIILQVLSAETPDEVLASAEATGAREVTDIPLELHAVRFLRSEYEEGLPFYAMLDAVNIDTGERIAVSCGAARVMAQLFKLLQFDALPVKVVVRQSTRPTKDGYWPLRLERAR